MSDSLRLMYSQVLAPVFRFIMVNVVGSGSFRLKLVTFLGMPPKVSFDYVAHYTHSSMLYRFVVLGFVKIA